MVPHALCMATIAAASSTSPTGAVADWLVVGGGPLGTIAVATLLRGGGESIFIEWMTQTLSKWSLGWYHSVPDAERSTGNAFQPTRLDFAVSQRRRGAQHNHCLDITGTSSSEAPVLGYLALEASSAPTDGSAALWRDPRVVTQGGIVISLAGDASAPRWRVQ